MASRLVRDQVRRTVWDQVWYNDAWWDEAVLAREMYLAGEISDEEYSEYLDTPR